MYFNFVKRLETKQNSIFYSLLRSKKNPCHILATGRRRYDERIVQSMILDNNFNIIKEDDVFLLKCEDPRSFYHNDCLYIQDNYLDDMHLINLSNSTSHKININGKNITFISHNGRLYFIHIMCPFTLYEYIVETGEIFLIDVQKQDFVNYEYRGGTPGYKINDNIYYGFGHRTYTNQYTNTLMHDIFYWEVNFSLKKPYIEMWNVMHPPNCLNICDPTSVININNKTYLITAETDFPWFQEQDYVTNIYEVIW